MSAIISLSLSAQPVPDSSGTPLEEVVVRAFEQNQRLKEIPAAVNYLGPGALSRFGNTSIVMAVNTTPGIRMEERSPGSYRINIRGSSLRSPFGVRNVKVYFNDIPITDPGGHTYLNQLGFFNFHSLEIIKGPGSSLYGAGTGGILLIESMAGNETPSIMTELAAGSFNMKNAYAAIGFGENGSFNKIGFQYQEADGYRAHSALSRKVFSWSGRYRFAAQTELKTTLLMGDLFYQTPGALTAAEYQNDPAAARPGGAGFPGAAAARASIRQRAAIAGISLLQPLTAFLSNRTTVYGMFTELRNPTIRNYGKNAEPHAGIRSSFHYKTRWGITGFSADLGSEWQRGMPTVDVHNNAGGQPGSLVTHDEIRNTNHFWFAQARISTGPWSLLTSASINNQDFQLQRFSPQAAPPLRKKTSNQLAPRISLSRTTPELTLYASVAKGFSPPTTAELSPSGSAINLGLDPETGINYDAGLKLSLWKGIFLDLNAFIFNLQNTIVQRRDSGGGDFFINSGKTMQKGIETQISGPVFNRFSRFWISHSFHHFRYREFRQVNDDYTGKQIPGISPHTVSTGIDYATASGWTTSFSYLFTGRMPLNDANTAFASHFHLLAVKLGKEFVSARHRIRLNAGIENLLNEQYSLGNDINGFGGRFFNAAPGRNYFASLSYQLFYRQ